MTEQLSQLIKELKPHQSQHYFEAFYDIFPKLLTRLFGKDVTKYESSTAAFTFANIATTNKSIDWIYYSEVTQLCQLLLPSSRSGFMTIYDFLCQELISKRRLSYQQLLPQILIKALPINMQYMVIIDELNKPLGTENYTHLFDNLVPTHVSNLPCYLRA